jgi:hypothetical protein
MAAIQIGEAATAGFRLMARRPFSVLTWGLVTAGYVGLIFALFGASLMTSVAGLVRSPGQTPTPQQIIGLIGASIGMGLLLGLGLLFLSAMVQGAVLRAELEPDKRGFAYLRLGRQELWLIAVNFVTAIVIWAACVVMMIPLFILAGVLGVGAAGLAGSNRGAGAVLPMLMGANLVTFIGQIVILGVAIWIWSRLSMGSVMSFRERQFRLFESWALTKGHALQIFLTMLLVVLILFVAEIVIGIILGAGVGATVFANQDLRDPAVVAAMPPTAWIGRLAPLLVIYALVAVLFVGFSNAMTWGAVARMYLQLNPPEDVAKTFA